MTQIGEMSGSKLDPDLVERFAQVEERTLSQLANAAEVTWTFDDTLVSCREADES